jgi:hypothetical protein
MNEDGSPPNIKISYVGRTIVKNPTPLSKWSFLILIWVN